MDSRPRNIGLGAISQYRFPITAIASILHRISGLLLFLFIPFLLWVFAISLHSEDGFISVQQCFASGVAKFFVWVFLSALAYHFIAGVKHLFMDVGFFEENCSGKAASITVLILSLIAVVLLGVWLW